MGICLPETALVLIAVMPSPRDLEIARVLGWYRIPLRHAPKVVSVDYLAFYQTGAFGSEARWRIQYFANVRGVELTTRAELMRDAPDHPRAQEEYYKIQIGPLQELVQPIQAGAWHRVTFLYSTGEIFKKAHTINDLVVRNEDRSVLWQSLRDRALQADYGNHVDLPEDYLDLDPHILAMLGELGKIKETIDYYSQW